MEKLNPYVIEFEKNASGYCWKLRNPDWHCIAKSSRDYLTIEEMNADLKKVIGAITFAKRKWITSK